MPPKKPKAPLTEYDKIRAVWYKRLEEDGFYDIEQDDNNLKVWSLSFVRKRPLELMESREAYYHMARKFLNDYAFADAKERYIWEQHAEGFGTREIAKTLLTSFQVKTNRTSVWQIIRRLEIHMKTLYILDYKDE